MNNENQTPTRSVDFYDNGAKFFEYTNPDGEITYGKVTPLANGNARFDWEGSAPEDWEDAEPFILADLRIGQEIDRPIYQTIRRHQQ
jgi:hypothetical protein